MFREYKEIRFFRVFLTLWITYATYTVVRRPLSVARANIQHDTGFTPAETSLVDCVFVFSYTNGQLLYGRISEYWGNKQILFYGILLSATALVCLALASTLPVFCLAWTINGIAQAAGWATCLSIMNVWVFPNERGRVMGWWSTNMAVGGLIGNIFPAFLIGKGFSWRVAVASEAAIILAVGGVVLLLLVQHPNLVGFPSVQQIEGGEQPTRWTSINHSFPLSKDGEVYNGTLLQPTGLPVQQHDPLQQNENELHKESGSLTLYSIIQLPGVRDICASYFLHKLVRYGFMFWLPYFAVQELKYTTEIAGYLTSAFDIGGVVGTVTSGYISDWMFHGRGRTRVVLLFTVGMVLGTLSFAIFSNLFAERALLFAAVTGIVGFFAFAIDALLSGSFLLDYLEQIQMANHAGAISGVVGGVGSVGSIFQGVFTVVLSTSSWSTLFYSFGLVTALAGVFLIYPLWRELEQKSKTSYAV
ncbi:MFS transporter, OPA family, solute carrier family 37 (glycerol-3-phosphate transporter), member 1/2 [Trypanosoma rangeli]|uniref:MFS transporter, OPA family, solute carrier family 37 (Glycerol-3-phosphate transporter), member 1/2 n=1 Tax=Trypanosoma rangeli TaxID=5698 RepID=A0A3R7KN34_TRYRA|nr:MFS transporter, OPA family, solute carrier family 37 (glycerol-3-phosphate transporter), member 1/2 [Trypanosoma rangeli]RNE97866.1 MFS transporter, OPA family, solute carrier family 37 (glycerol-3-phosphate transporter), member 1/2 [Trypanosoma rangeli]|eukprot:RNE97866.1 MFS transporter, OPA family, solute carrier family 37 (glycerol-3-phosphate transporter), member 1/2 [Trypanosoma rangeli]